MLKVGLTGSIAVGKSFVCGIFRELGCFVLDADETARDVVAAGTDGFRRVIEAFGSEVRAENGEIDRAKLGSIVFADEAKRRRLNSIVHPMVIEAQNRWLADREKEAPDEIAVIEAALMIESGSYKRLDNLIVVWCEPDIQLQRLMLRQNLDLSGAKRRIAAQMPQEEKKRFADFLIDTSHSVEDTRHQTIEIFEQLMQLRLCKS